MVGLDRGIQTAAAMHLGAGAALHSLVAAALLDATLQVIKCMQAQQEQAGQEQEPMTAAEQLVRTVANLAR